jgi:hypothetical protein
VYIPSERTSARVSLCSRRKASYPGEDTGDTDDNDDNGQDTPVSGGIASNVIDAVRRTTSRATNPVRAATQRQRHYPGTLDDDNVNETVDFTVSASRKLP